MPLRLNNQKSEVLSSTTIQIVLDGDSREEVDSPAAREMALQVAGQHGYGNAGLSEAPMVGAIDTETDDILDGPQALDPNRPRSGYRGYFKINKRL